jgi:dienelactone hydrolase
VNGIAIRPGDWLTPAMYPAPGLEAPGVRALFYEGPVWRGQPTRLFAWYGAPAVKPGHRVPAMVLVHGGGGTAFARWVRLWVERGYAALAMDTGGCIPVGGWAKWQRHLFAGPFPHQAVWDVESAPEDHWPWYAVAAVTRGHSLLRSFPEVDAERIGLVGISWGGHLACLLAGLDPRYRCATSVYGCGFLGENSVFAETTFREQPPERTARWLAGFDPKHYLPSVAVPMLWVTGTNDFAFPLDSLQRSYRLPPGPRTLAIRVRMEHGHQQGEAPEDMRVYADAVMKGGSPVPRFTAQGRDERRAWATFEAAAPIEKAELAYTADAGRWQDRRWAVAPARLAAWHVEADVPDGTRVYFFNLHDPRGAVASSEHVEVG